MGAGTMIERTERRLRAAKFFYQHLVTERQRTGINEPEAFEFYFGAFIEAARSIPWVLQNEEREKYDAWLPKVVASVMFETLSRPRQPRPSRGFFCWGPCQRGRQKPAGEAAPRRAAPADGHPRGPPPN